MYLHAKHGNIKIEMEKNNDSLFIDEIGVHKKKKEKKSAKYIYDCTRIRIAVRKMKIKCHAKPKS